VSDELSIQRPTYRVPRRGMDAGTRRLALIAGCLGAALLAIVGGWSMMGHRSTVVPVIQADSRPVRVKPENAGGMQIAGANEDLGSSSYEAGAGKLAPPPEAPAPQALRAPPPPAIIAAPVAASVATLPTPTTAKPVAPPEKRLAVPAPDRAAADRAAADRTASAAKGAFVQLAAVASEEAARSEWQRLEKQLPDLFNRRQPAFSKTERNGRTLWRLRTGGFSDAAQATAFCERVHAKGAGCSIADF
jgi:hypothetical protein